MARAVGGARLDLFHAIDHNLSPWLPVPTLVTVHDLILEVLRGPYLGPTAWLWMRSHRTAARRARKVIAVSESTRRDLERVWGIPGERIAVVHEGVEGRFRPPADLEEVHASLARLGIFRPYFLYVGGFDPRKNLHNLLLGFKRALRGGAGGLQLVLAGDAGGFEEYLHDEIIELGLEREVVLPGFVAAEDLPLLYGGALAFAFPSLYEGFGLPLLEAMACGTPVLAAANSSIPEVVGDAALLVDPLDPAAIGRGLADLAADGGSAEAPLRPRARARRRLLLGPRRRPGPGPLRGSPGGRGWGALTPPPSAGVSTPAGTPPPGRSSSWRSWGCWVSSWGWPPPACP